MGHQGGCTVVKERSWGPCTWVACQPSLPPPPRDQPRAFPNEVSLLFLSLSLLLLRKWAMQAEAGVGSHGHPVCKVELRLQAGQSTAARRRGKTHIQACRVSPCTPGPLSPPRPHSCTGASQPSSGSTHRQLGWPKDRRALPVRFPQQGLPSVTWGRLPLSQKRLLPSDQKLQGRLWSRKASLPSIAEPHISRCPVLFPQTALHHFARLFWLCCGLCEPQL